MIDALGGEARAVAYACAGCAAVMRRRLSQVPLARRTCAASPGDLLLLGPAEEEAAQAAATPVLLTNLAYASLKDAR